MLKALSRLALMAVVIGGLLGYFGGDTASATFDADTWLPWREDVLRYFETAARSL